MWPLILLKKIDNGSNDNTNTNNKGNPSERNNQLLIRIKSIFQFFSCVVFMSGCLGLGMWVCMSGY